jgi:hypothetical protein
MSWVFWDSERHCCLAFGIRPKVCAQGGTIVFTIDNLQGCWDVVWFYHFGCSMDVMLICRDSNLLTGDGLQC